MACDECDRLRRDLREAKEELAEYRADRPAPVAVNDNADRMGRWMKALDCPYGQVRLLMTFVESPGRAFDRDALLDHLEGFGRSEQTDRAIDTRIKRLRASLRAALRTNTNPISTLYGIGYVMDAPTAHTIKAMVGEAA